MSGVFKRNRNLSSCQWYTSAVDLRIAVTQLAHSSAVPKSWRFTFAEPMCATAREVVFDVVKSDAFYPNTAEKVELRKKHLTLAIAGCEMLYQDLQCLMAMNTGLNANRLEQIAEMIDSEIELLKSARSGVRLIGRKGVQ